MNLRELMTSTPYTTVHAPRRSYVAYSTHKRSGTEVEQVAHINMCDHPSLTRLRALANLATIPLPIYNREGARTVKKDDYALHYKDLSPHAAVTSYLESLNAARIPAALHHPTDGWSTNRSWMCSLYPDVLDELVHAAAQRRAALTTTTKGTDQ